MEEKEEYKEKRVSKVCASFHEPYSGLFSWGTKFRYFRG